MFRRKKLLPHPLDRPLLAFSPGDPWTIRDACEGTQIFGATGGGKTTGSGANVACAMLHARFGGMVMCAKPEERATWERYCQITGRTDDLIVIGPDTMMKNGKRP